MVVVVVVVAVVVVGCSIRVSNIIIIITLSA